ncbi:MAG: hypothetical protein C4293_12495 [Nitrospiraceae bacterium]
MSYLLLDASVVYVIQEHHIKLLCDSRCRKTGRKKTKSCTAEASGGSISQGMRRNQKWGQKNRAGVSVIEEARRANPASPLLSSLI